MEGYQRDKLEYLVGGFRTGFSLGFTGNIVKKKDCRNLKSAYEHPEVIEQKIKLELDAGRFMGPFDEPPFDNLITSPIGLQPKKKPGEFRLITHLSHPHGASVNSGIPDEFSSVQYNNVSDAIKIIKEKGRNCYMAKTDVKNAFRLIPINPKDYYLLGIKWAGKYYIDRNLAMGASSSCAIFEEFSTALQWIAMNKLGIKAMIHILDDFLIISFNKQLCAYELEKFIRMCRDIGVPIAEEKTFGPNRVMEFAGIELSSISMIARLPKQKIEKCTEAIEKVIIQTRVKLKDIQQISGLLNFACIVVYPGRPFLRRLYNLTVGVTNKHIHITLTDEVKGDLVMWLNFLSKFNGKNFFMNDWWISDQKLNLFTDAARSSGYGAIFSDEWFHGIWEKESMDLDITTLEFYPIVIAMLIWGHNIKNMNINIHTDNEALVSIINNQTVKKNIYCLKLLRIFVLTCLQLNICIRAFHIKGSLNVLSDALSRQQVARFKELAPHMKPDPTPVPQSLSLQTLLKI